MHSISIVLRTKLLSHDLNAFWCVRLPSRDTKSMLNVATFLKTAVHDAIFLDTFSQRWKKKSIVSCIQHFTRCNLGLQFTILWFQKTNAIVARSIIKLYIVQSLQSQNGRQIIAGIHISLTLFAIDMLTGLRSSLENDRQHVL